MTIITTEVLRDIFNEADNPHNLKKMSAHLKFCTGNNFWGVNAELKLMSGSTGRGVMVTLFRDGHVTVRPQTTFSNPTDKTPMLVLQEGSLGFNRVLTNGTNEPIEPKLDMSAADLMGLLVENYPSIKFLADIKP